MTIYLYYYFLHKCDAKHSCIGKKFCNRSMYLRFRQ